MRSINILLLTSYVFRFLRVLLLSVLVTGFVIRNFVLCYSVISEILTHLMVMVGLKSFRKY